jgi:predicted ATPase
LHVHTPDSVYHEYGANDEDVWQKFILDLEHLPPEFKVVGINDYILVDGYRRLLRERSENHRLQNIDLLLPVIELRLDKFCGTRGHFNKVNYHVIFSESIPPDTIQSQFINALSNRYVLAPEYVGQHEWRATPTRESLTDLGERLIASSPAEKRGQFGPPLKEGFNNLTLRLEDISDALDKPYFKEKYLTAVGKTEWGDMAWNDNSIAEKKHVINSADLVFTASASPQHWANARQKLIGENVNDRLLDCSDAHSFSDSTQKDRIGNCFTWVKSDTTFDGLKHAIKEFDARIFVGDEPQKLKSVRSNKTKYIRAVGLHKRPKSNPAEIWFDDDIPLSTDLIAVIGRKGSGKSAFTDTVGLLGNSRQEAQFGFLNSKRFREPRDNKSEDYSATLVWEDGPPETKGLDEKVDRLAVERVKYIPQDFLEDICNPAEGGQETDFDRELKSVIFSHVLDSDRLGQDSLDALISYKSQEKEKELVLMREQLSNINRQIVEMEGKITREYRLRVENEIKAKENELKSHDTTKPAPVEIPQASPEQDVQAMGTRGNVEAAKKRQIDLKAEIRAVEGEQKEQSRLLAIADRVLVRIDNFTRQYADFVKQLTPDLQSLGMSVDQVVHYNLNRGVVNDRRKSIVDARDDASRLLDPANPDGPFHKLSQAEETIKSLQGKLDEPSKRYEAYTVELGAWTAKTQEIIGDAESPGTIEYYKSLLEQVKQVPHLLADLRAQRIEKVKEIYRSKSGVAELYAELYKPVKDLIEKHELAKERLQLDFQVCIVEAGFTDRFLNKINQGARGSFNGKDEGRQVVNGIREKHNFKAETGALAFLEELMDHLAHDKRLGGQGKEVKVGDQLVRGETPQGLYDFIFGLDYLTPRYTLRMGDKELNQLSPGEKGSLLLIFFLLVDKSDVPLVVDQPEENLDNETVFHLLVPCIKEAKQRRQIIIVTHNPNLAVVCDAEQIIHAFESRKGPRRIIYTSGSIENPEINRKILDVLEGTRPAFENRESKYLL